MADDKRRRAVLYMIIFNAVAMHIPVTALVFGSNSSNPDSYIRPYMIYEKIQLTVFFVQECIISGLYVWETIRLLQVTKDIRGERGARRVMNHLIFVNVVVILLDISVLALEFSDYYDLQTGYKPLVYSIKLKMELSILNQLVQLTRSASQGSLSFSNSNNTGLTPSITLETFNHHPQRRLRNDIGGADMGYKASIDTSGHHDPESSSAGARVVRETEISIEPRTRHHELGCGRTFDEPSSSSSIASEHDLSDAVSTSSMSRFGRIAR